MRAFFGAYNQCATEKHLEVIDTRRHMDAEEFLGRLFLTLGDCWKNKDSFKDQFGGVLVQTIAPKYKHAPFVKEEEFFTLQLEVKGKQSITESLDAYVACETLEGVFDQSRCSEALLLENPSKNPHCSREAV
jgi:hypothetical protein